MADFCKQCSEEIFKEDHGDLKGLGNGKVLPEGQGWLVLCEGCGLTTVNDEGVCFGYCMQPEHKEKGKEND